MANIKNLKVNGTTYGINAHSADTATSASKLSSNKTISLTGAITGSVSTDFSSNPKITTSVEKIPEAKLSWGGGNFQGSFGPIDAAMISSLGADRLAFGNVDAITIEASKDGGATWTTVNDDDMKRKIFSSAGTFATLYIGNDTRSGIDKSNYMIRVTIKTNLYAVYTELNKFAIYVSTEGSSGSYCTITARTKANVDSGSDTWVTFANKIPLGGWGGWNIINTEKFTTYGNTDYQYQQIRFTFGVTSHAATVAYPGLTLNSIMGFGGNGWSTPSSMAENGHLYSWDIQQNARFPKNVAAESFSGNGYQLTSLHAGRIEHGTLSADRLPTSGVTSGSYGPTANVTGTNGATINVPQITVDSKGRVTSVVNRTYTSKDTHTTYSIATASTPGLVKPISVITKPTLNSVTTTSGRYYSVQMSSDGAMFVNVPWQAIHADYYHSTGSWNGLTYTATAHEGAPELKFTIPTGITGTTVAVGNHTHSQYLTAHQDISGKADLSGATFTGAVTLKAGVSLKFNKIEAPTTPGGSTYSNGSSGQVLKSNGSTVYWAASDPDAKTSSSNTTNKIYLVGATYQSFSGQSTYSNSNCYASGGYLYSNGKKVDMDNISGGVEWSTF